MKSAPKNTKVGYTVIVYTVQAYAYTGLYADFKAETSALRSVSFTLLLTSCLSTYYSDVSVYTGPDLGGGAGGPGPQASHQKGPPTKPFNFYFALTIG